MFLLNRIQEAIKSQMGDDSASASNFRLIEPRCTRTRTKSTWLNFADQAKALNRDTQHILNYFMSELGCDGTIGANEEMILTGGYQAKNFLRLIRKYIEDFVKCKDCKGYVTEIEKDPKTRLRFLKCKKCQASRTVNKITSQFKAVKRGERKKGRQ
jgi:translation initiation factor 2 subunit 2